VTPVITPAVAKRLLEIVERFRDEVQVPAQGSWESMTAGALWAKVLGQIAVVGSAASGRALNEELGADVDAWFARLSQAAGDARRREIHRRLRNAGVRYVTPDHLTCKKTGAALYDFDLLETYDGPRRYFEHLASVPVEDWRISIVADEMAYIRNKGARDLLIELGLVRNAIAFDSRLKTVLTKVGAELPKDVATNRARYRSLEQELIAKVCVPAGITGGHLDRILFNRSKEAVA
jgi:hypothetical protein